MITDIANGISQLHAKDIIHCDLKPENVLVTVNDQGNLHAKITDLGLSKKKGDIRDICSTPYYSAPECLQRKKQGKKSDVYSTSLLIWETLSAPIRLKTHVFSGIYTIPHLSGAVTNGPLRPPVIDSFPQKVGMWMERSWSQQAKNRPTSAELATAFNALTDNDMQKTYKKKSTV